MSISDANMVASTPLDENVVLTLKVDKTGAFSLVEAEIPNSVLEALPYLESTLNEAVVNLPQALPATKTNVGSMLIPNLLCRSKSGPSPLNEFRRSNYFWESIPEPPSWVLV